MAWGERGVLQGPLCAGEWGPSISRLFSAFCWLGSTSVLVQTSVCPRTKSVCLGVSWLPSFGAGSADCAHAELLWKQLLPPGWLPAPQLGAPCVWVHFKDLSKPLGC